MVIDKIVFFQDHFILFMESVYFISFFYTSMTKYPFVVENTWRRCRSASSRFI